MINKKRIRKEMNNKKKTKEAMEQHEDDQGNMNNKKTT
jgi:hypothetical protein